MGNREALLSGAVRCLYEKGYARTTARDIAKASRVSLAAIGYHFGSVDALLNAALIQAIMHWGDELDRALSGVPTDELAPAERFEAIWARMIELFAKHRPLWAAQIEALAQSEHAPELRRFLAEAQEEGRLGLARLFQSLDPTVDRETALAVGSFHQALLFGVMSQWLADPEQAPSASELTRALRWIASDVGRTAAAPSSKGKKPRKSPGR